MSDTPVDVPLLEILDSVPLNGRAIWDTSSTSSRSIPYGNICYQSALRIRNLERELTEARRELEDVSKDCNGWKKVAVDQNDQKNALQSQLTAHKEALEKCEILLKPIVEEYHSSEYWLGGKCEYPINEALAAIAKCKEVK